MIVPRRLTPVPLAGLLEQLDAAHHDLRGCALSADAYRLAEAHLRLEHGTADGALRGVWCYNFGNHDASRADLADPAVPVFSTVPEQEYDPHGRGYHQVHTRRAYADAEEGLIGYWTTLLDGFPAAYDALSTGDPDAFALALKSAGYYTADEATYTRALRGLMPPSY